MTTTGTKTYSMKRKTRLADEVTVSFLCICTTLAAAGAFALAILLAVNGAGDVPVLLLAIVAAVLWSAVLVVLGLRPALLAIIERLSQP